MFKRKKQIKCFFCDKRIKDIIIYTYKDAPIHKHCLNILTLEGEEIGNSNTK